MAFYSGTKTNQNLVFGNKGEIRNLSFASSEAAIDARQKIRSQHPMELLVMILVTRWP